MPAQFPQTAAAQAAGAISAAHARIVTTTINRLPAAMRDERFDEIESFLVSQAQQFCPSGLASVSRRMADTLHPDGAGLDTAYRERTRGLSLRQRPDGSSRGRSSSPRRQPRRC